MEPENIVVLFYYLPLMQAAFKKFTAEEWRLWGERVKEGVQVVRTPEEAFSDELLLAEGSVVEVADPDLGPIRHLGVITELGRTPGAVQGPAPRRGEHTADVMREAADSPDVQAGSPTLVDARSEGPLAGVRVLDIGLALAGPYGTSLLADLGADVIKVMAPWDGPWMDTGIGQMANRGKRGVLLNLGKPCGLEAFYKLVETADVVAHNMRDGVAERLGVDYEKLRAIKPDLIYCASRGFDRDRSSRGLPGTDQSGSALAGQEWEDGGCWHGGQPFFGTSMGDLGNGFLTAIAVNEALFHRREPVLDKPSGRPSCTPVSPVRRARSPIPTVPAPPARSSTPSSSVFTPYTASTRRRTAGSASPPSPRNTGSTSAVSPDARTCRWTTGSRTPSLAARTTTSSGRSSRKSSGGAQRPSGSPPWTRRACPWSCPNRAC